MKVLLIPTTEGYGHVSRTLAIISGLKSKGIDYKILTDASRADFLIQNGVNGEKIDRSLFGISFAYRRRNGNYNLNVPLTIGKVILSAPFYLTDICRVISYFLIKERFDLVINDLSLHLIFVPGVKVLNIGHYCLPSGQADLKRMSGDPHCLWYEGLIEPVITLPSLLTKRFWMDLRPSRIDNKKVFPPIISPVTRTRTQIREELGIPENARLIIDGRSHVHSDTYSSLTTEYDDIFVLTRSECKPDKQVITRPFIPQMVNYVAASDLFITNPGFTSIAEGAVSGTRMLFNHPGNHAEQRKNLHIACHEGYGSLITDFERDILTSLEKKTPHNSLKNGLTLFMEVMTRTCNNEPRLSSPANSADGGTRS